MPRYQRKSTMRVPFAVLAAILSLATAATSVAGDVAPAPNGITIPEGYRDWSVIGVSHRTDNNTLRMILGNDAAIAAARAGRTNPWPDGAILAKIVMKDTTHASWPAATVPGQFVHAEFMLKDQAKYAATGGWGYARWVGTDQKPYGNDADFVQECHGCHTCEAICDQDACFVEEED